MRLHGNLVWWWNYLSYLVGDDSIPRKVLERIDGFGPMYRITPTNGVAFEVADHHILCLVKSGNCKNDKYPDGHIVELTVADYLKRSKWFRHQYKLYKVAVEWPAKSVTVDPYWLGLWLGDGNWNSPIITTDDQEAVDAIEKYAAELGLRFVSYKKEGKTPRYGIVKVAGPHNILWGYMRGYGLLQSCHKFIPRDYKVNSRGSRLQLLAGLMDSDGSLNEGTDFDFVNTNLTLTDDVAFVARSLGFRVHQTTRGCKGFGVEVDAYRLRITGNTHLIPTKISRKQAHERKQKKHPLRTGFAVERIADGPYVGVRLDGNHRYLLGDFTVTHNTHLIAAIIRAHDPEELCYRNTPLTVVVTPGIDLAKKNYQALKEQLPARDVGLVCTGVKRFSEDVQVVTPESLDHVPMETAGLLFYDEVHTLSYSRAESVMKASKALRWGFSATPSGRFDGADKVVEGVVGPVVYQRTYQEAVVDGAVVPIRVYWLDCPEVAGWRHFTTHDANYRNGIWRNAAGSVTAKTAASSLISGTDGTRTRRATAVRPARCCGTI